MPRKRFKRPHARPGQLLMQWGVLWYDPKSPDLQACWESPSTRGDVNLLLHVFYHLKGEAYESGFVKELEKRGYDLSTLKFSCMKKEVPGDTSGGS